jgi:dTDP-4-amino-4,6-dideoxy-D-galactose acyltransferase
MGCTGSSICRYLDWDSEFFGVRVARLMASRLDPVTVESVLTWCGENSIQCLYFLADSGDAQTVRLAEDKGFRFVDIRVTLTSDTATSAASGIDHAVAVIRSSDVRDIPQLRMIARASHRDSRFYYDGHFPRQVCDALYETWIEKSCSGYADKVLVAESAEQPVGYITCHDEAQTAGRIGLVGVHADYQGLGIGRRLVTSALQFLAGRGVKRVGVTTQGRNDGAQRLYQRCGFATSSVELWYHRWFVPQHCGGER